MQHYKSKMPSIGARRSRAWLHMQTAGGFIPCRFILAVPALAMRGSGRDRPGLLA